MHYPEPPPIPELPTPDEIHRAMQAVEDVWPDLLAKVRVDANGAGGGKLVLHFQNGWCVKVDTESVVRRLIRT